MVCGSDIKVVFPLFEIVENPAQVGKGAVVPETLRFDLQFDVDDSAAIEQHLDIQDKILVANFLAKFEWIENRDGLHLFDAKMEQGGDQSFEHFFI